MAKKKEYTVEEIIELLKDENETIENKLLRNVYIKKLYKQVGDPKEEDFPDEYKIAGRCWKKEPGYTKDIGTSTETCMKLHNEMQTNWCVERPSQTKIEIVEDYTRAGWTCTVQAYNVICIKYVQHPKYKDLWVRFYSSRDCNRYEYIICCGE